MAYTIEQMPKGIQDVWQRLEEQGWSDPWYSDEYGLYGYRPNAHMEDDRAFICKEDEKPVAHLGDPCVFCGIGHDDVPVGDCRCFLL